MRFESWGGGVDIHKGSRLLLSGEFLSCLYNAAGPVLRLGITRFQVRLLLGPQSRPALHTAMHQAALPRPPSASPAVSALTPLTLLCGRAPLRQASLSVFSCYTIIDVDGFFGKGPPSSLDAELPTVSERLEGGPVHMPGSGGRLAALHVSCKRLALHIFRCYGGPAPSGQVPSAHRRLHASAHAYTQHFIISSSQNLNLRANVLFAEAVTHCKRRVSPALMQGSPLAPAPLRVVQRRRSSASGSETW